MNRQSTACGAWLAGIGCAMMSGTSVLAGGPDVPTYTNETSTRLSGPTGTTSADTTDKDFGIGDLDGDGDMDIVVARRTRLNPPAGESDAAAERNTLLMNIDGVLTDMTFDLAPDMQVLIASRDVLVEDLNNDGLLDVMFAHGISQVPQVLLNQGFSRGDDSWAGLANAPAGMVPAGVTIDAWSIASADVTGDGDGYPDVYLGVKVGTDRMLINQGEVAGVWQGFADESSRLGSAASISGHARSAAFADVNNDGDQDLVVDYTSPTGQTRTHANDGSGNFNATGQTLFSGAAYNFGLGELDGDGNIDFFGVRNSSDQYRQNLGSVGETLTLGAIVTAPNTNGFGSIVHTADVNHDGTDDFLVCDLDQEFPLDCGNRLKVLLNAGSAPFLSSAYASPQPWTPGGTSDIKTFDIDGDGDLDWVIGHCSGISVFTKDGSLGFDPADLNEDGVVGPADLALLLGDWNCTEPPDCLGDIDGDGMTGAADLALLLGSWG